MIVHCGKRVYLERATRYDRFKVGNRKASATTEMKNQTKQRELSSFLWLLGVTRKIIPNLSCTVDSLNKKLCKEERTQLQTLSVIQMNAFKQIKLFLTNPPAFAFPQADGYLKMSTDACNTQLSYISLK